MRNYEWIQINLKTLKLQLPLSVLFQRKQFLLHKEEDASFLLL